MPASATHAGILLFFLTRIHVDPIDDSSSRRASKLNPSSIQSMILCSNPTHGSTSFFCRTFAIDTSHPFIDPFFNRMNPRSLRFHQHAADPPCSQNFESFSRFNDPPYRSSATIFVLFVPDQSSRFDSIHTQRHSTWHDLPHPFVR